MSKTIYEGKYFVVRWAIGKTGRCPGEEFFNGLSIGEQAQVLALFMRFADFGKITSSEQFKKVIGTNCFEFKRFQIRFFCFFYGRANLIIGSGFKKKTDKTPKAEIDRALRLMREHMDR